MADNPNRTVFVPTKTTVYARLFYTFLAEEDFGVDAQKFFQTLVVNIKRRYFADILVLPRRKWIEYRDLSEYWESRLEKAGKPPFDLRLLNGMTPPFPEANVRVTKVVRRKSAKTIELHLGNVLSTKYWDWKKERTTR
jgi:hypothetical protein